MKYSTLLAVLLSGIVTGCATTPSPPAASFGDITGTWGEDEADCQSNPHTITFSSQGDVMHVRYSEGGTADGQSLQEQFSYNVLGRSSLGLKLSLVGESRMDSFGNPVTWELRQADRDSYCWWRSDWPANECTVSRTRCVL
jgi:hypothetical protein